MIYTTKLLEEKMIKCEEEFNLKEALLTNQVDLIFGDIDELLDEEHEYTRGNMAILIRNKEERNLGKHGFTMKLRSANRVNDKNFYHDGYFGLPITFKKGESDWSVFLGPSREKIKRAEEIYSSLTDEEKSFVTAVVTELGDYIYEYWEVTNIGSDISRRKLDKIVHKIEYGYLADIKIDHSGNFIYSILNSLSNKEKEDLQNNYYFDNNAYSIYSTTILVNNVPIAFAELYNIPDGSIINHI